MEPTARPIETTSRALRVTAFQRRRRVIGGFGVLGGTKDMVTFSISDRPTHLMDTLRVKAQKTTDLSTLSGFSEPQSLRPQELQGESR